MWVGQTLPMSALKVGNNYINEISDTIQYMTAQVVYRTLIEYGETRGRRNSHDCWTLHPNNLPHEVQLAQTCIMASPASYSAPQKRTSNREDLNVAKPCSNTLWMSLLRITSEL